MSGIKTYTVIALSGYGEDSDFNILYSGGDYEEVGEFDVNGYYHTLILQVWVGAKVIRKFTKKINNSNDWIKEFDIMEKLKNEIRGLDDKKEKLLNELLELQALTGEK